MPRVRSRVDRAHLALAVQDGAAMNEIDQAQLCTITGGLDNGCAVTNWSTSKTLTPDGGSPSQLDWSQSQIVAPGKFTVAGKHGSVSETCSPGTSFNVLPPRGDTGFGVMPYSS